MTTCYINEYPDAAIRQGTASPGLDMPPVVSQTVAIGGGSLQSAVWNSKTRLVGVSVDAVASVEFGANPTATATSFRLPANTITFWRVTAGQRMAVITNT